MKADMESSETIEIGSSTLRPGTLTADSLPSLLAAPKGTNKRILVQRRKSFTASYPKPSPGQEYDYRRSPDGRASPRKYTNGRIRPHVPPDTTAMDSAMSLEYRGSPVRNIASRKRQQQIPDRCPTPRPRPVTSYSVTSSSRPVWKPCKPAAPGPSQSGALENNSDTDTDLPVPRANFMAPKRKPKQKYDVILSDLEHERRSSTLTPTPGHPLDLTENVIHYYFQNGVDKDRRITRWLVDCEEQTCASSLPAHLPDIEVTRRHVVLSP